jgi:uncharacterized membrane-anchored protein
MLKKGLVVLHILSGLLAVTCIFIFIQNAKHPWLYKTFLLCYIISGAIILTIFFKTLPLFTRVYFEVLFLVPLGIMAFWFFTRLFEYLFFGP